jgi:cytochrome c-type biogenesis protein CcmH/NrfF
MKRAITHIGSSIDVPSTSRVPQPRSGERLQPTAQAVASPASLAGTAEFSHTLEGAKETIAKETRSWVAPRFSAAIKAVCPSTALAAEARKTIHVRALRALILAAAVFLFLAAAPPSPDARFHDLGHRMMCTCGCGQILLECNHVGCQSSEKMRNQLMAAITRGGGDGTGGSSVNNDDLILQGFVQEYGPTVIAAPSTTGFNRVAWIMPFAVLALGIAFAVHTVRTWKNRPEPALADGIVIPQQSPELDTLRARARKETDL